MEDIRNNKTKIKEDSIKSEKFNPLSSLNNLLSNSYNNFLLFIKLYKYLWLLISLYTILYHPKPIAKFLAKWYYSFSSEFYNNSN